MLIRSVIIMFIMLQKGGVNMNKDPLPLCLHLITIKYNNSNKVWVIHFMEALIVMPAAVAIPIISDNSKNKTVDVLE